MTCAKRYVSALLKTKSGNTYHGTNACRRPQPVCPRIQGGYSKCRRVCKQPWHAETHAMFLALCANDDPTGGHISVNYDPCHECQEHMEAWDITWESDQL